MLEMYDDDTTTPRKYLTGLPRSGVQTPFKLVENIPPSYIGVCDGTYFAAALERAAERELEPYRTKQVAWVGQVVAQLYAAAGDARMMAAAHSQSKAATISHREDAEALYKKARWAENNSYDAWMRDQKERRKRLAAAK